MRIRLRRNRSFWLRDIYSLEWYPVAALQALVRPGDMVWDIGANIGLYSRLLANKFDAGNVVAFEPMSGCFIAEQACEALRPRFA